MIGDYEYLVLTASARLGHNAYGPAIQRILADAGRAASIGGLYTTLERLERKGLVTTQMSKPTQARGGRARRMVTLTEDGIHAAAAFHEAINRVTQDVSWASR